MSATHIDRQTFLEHLRRSKLLSDQEISAVVKRLPDSDRGRVVARALVEWGLITKFQAELLLVGRTNGFTLGQYRILDQIGTGGMGRVFRARHLTMDRIVALKVLAPQLVKTERARQLFQREAQAAGRLVHPNIVTAYDANQVDGRHYLVMEYVDGPNLDQLVRECGPLPVGLACDVVRQVANGLQCAFEREMVHRDIKPSNILVQRPGGNHPAQPCVAKILDFGLARLQGAADKPGGGHTILTRANTIMGTPDYVSPEQARDMHLVDIRSDLYSLGCTFYYLLTGRVPFPGGTSMEKLVRQSSEEPMPVEELRPDVPLAVAAIVRRLMAKEPGDRFATPADLAAALEPLSRPGPAADKATGGPTPLLGDTDGLSADPGDWIEDASGGTSDEASAMDATLPPDLSPTPLSALSLPSAVMSDGSPKGTQPRLMVTILCAAGLVGGLIAVITMLLLGL
jgi:serine/threonine-protein kinase